MCGSCATHREEFERCDVWGRKLQTMVKHMQRVKDTRMGSTILPKGCKRFGELAGVLIFKKDTQWQIIRARGVEPQCVYTGTEVRDREEVEGQGTWGAPGGTGKQSGQPRARSLTNGIEGNTASGTLDAPSSERPANSPAVHGESTKCCTGGLGNWHLARDLGTCVHGRSCPQSQEYKVFEKNRLGSPGHQMRHREAQMNRHSWSGSRRKLQSRRKGGSLGPQIESDRDRVKNSGRETLCCTASGRQREGGMSSNERTAPLVITWPLSALLLEVEGKREGTGNRRGTEQHASFHKRIGKKLDMVGEKILGNKNDRHQTFDIPIVVLYNAKQRVKTRENAKWEWHTELMSMVEQFSDHFPDVESIKFIESRRRESRGAHFRAVWNFQDSLSAFLGGSRVFAPDHSDQGKSDQPTSQPALQPPKQSSSKWTEKDAEWDPADWG
ncbi:hypothetical protein B0H11DRAFT_2206383 [Mycena galericulata]|nr:hypothetical protein B0H11DRAFT_2206383 [Mycena galericulata]